MDQEVLTLVLDRDVRSEELAPAILPDFRRVASPGVVYPRLVEDAASKVTGLALAAPRPRDLVRLAWFEDGEYEPVRNQVLLLDGGLAQAWLFRAFDEVLAADHRLWCPLSWSLHDKPSYLMACPRWMVGCPEPDDDHPFLRRIHEEGPRKAA
jgi:hypothetical protein